jgi:hypothetical protein
MTMHQPCSRVIGDECYDKVAIRGKHCDVSTGRICELKRRGVDIEDTTANPEDVEVMAMKVNRMRYGNYVADDGLDNPEGRLEGQESVRDRQETSGRADRGPEGQREDIGLLCWVAGLRSS